MDKEKLISSVQRLFERATGQTSLDGRERHYALTSINIVLDAIREPSEGVYLERPVNIPERSDWQEIWMATIDALKKEMG